jgi:hypothetical protein
LVRAGCAQVDNQVWPTLQHPGLYQGSFAVLDLYYLYTAGFVPIVYLYGVHCEPLCVAVFCTGAPLGVYSMVCYGEFLSQGMRSQATTTLKHNALSLQSSVPQ